MVAPPLILITRPAEEAQLFADALEAMGLASFAEPLLEIRPKAFTPPEPGRYQGILFSSARAVDIYAARMQEQAQKQDQAMPVYTVGPQTAAAAARAGFVNVMSAEGNAQDLAALVKARAGVVDWPFLHVRGEHVSQPLHVLLGAHGFHVDLLMVYTAQPVDHFTSVLIEKLNAGDVTAVTLFSKRTAQSFLDLVAKHNLAHALQSIKALCISEEVLKCVQPYRWASTHVAPRPDRDGMLALSKAVCA